MSDRRLSPTGDRLRDQLRRLEERIYRLENGGATAGRLSFDTAIQISDVEIQVSDAGGDSRTVTFRNVLTGTISTINLP